MAADVHEQARLLRDREQLLQRHPRRLAPAFVQERGAPAEAEALDHLLEVAAVLALREGRRRARGVDARGLVDLLHEPHVEPEAAQPQDPAQPDPRLTAVQVLVGDRAADDERVHALAVMRRRCSAAQSSSTPVEDVQERGALAGDVVSPRRRERPRAQLVQPGSSRSAVSAAATIASSSYSGRKQFSPGRQNERLPMQSGHTTTVPTAMRLQRGQVEALLRVRDEHAHAGAAHQPDELPARDALVDELDDPALAAQPRGHRCAPARAACWPRPARRCRARARRPSRRRASRSSPFGNREDRARAPGRCASIAFVDLGADADPDRLVRQEAVAVQRDRSGTRARRAGPG